MAPSLVTRLRQLGERGRAILAGAALTVSVAADATTGWAFQPLAPTPPPVVRQTAWARNPVDRFILARWEASGVQPAPEADRATWLRRVSFDLTGLPPAPAEYQNFLRDSSPEAHERVIDRLLASPAHGERWARHWLDVVRFGESQGFEFDHIREHAWRYRDYVIAAFNTDKPYDQFIREQLAGDVLEPVTPEGIVATSFLVAGPYDQAASISASAPLRAAAREAELEDMLGTIGQTFLGVTLNCARCHDHKFDPIPARDYYRIQAVFRGVRHGNRRLHPATNAPQAYAANPQPVEPAFVLPRGDASKRGEPVTPGALSAVRSISTELGLTNGSTEAERRRRFAAWVANPGNPLTARSIVNRIWQHHFGHGLVGTPNDFGRQGARPSHPELLDWLADWFVSPAGGDWRLKRLHRLLVTSAVYRQAGFPGAAGGEAGFVGFPASRLEAEAARDALLVLSGELDTSMGGPGFRPFTHKSNGGQNEYFPADRTGPGFDRRTIYRVAVHSARDPLLDALDCPEFSTRTPVRPVTVTPLQALSLMNDPLVLRQAAAMARRLENLARGKTDEQLEALWWHALGRAPTAEERKRGRQLTEDHGLSTTVWAVFNSGEFLTIR